MNRGAPVKRLSIVIPCYNEVATIDAVVAAVRSIELECERELVLVDDGSKDGTREKLQSYGEEDDVQVVLLPKNMGKGAAVRAGFARATGDVVLIQDADLEYDPRDYGRLLEPIIDGRADVVYGSRFRGSQPGRVLFFWHRLGNGLLTLLSNVFTDLNLTDMETGYKVFRREVLDQLDLREDRFGIEPELTAKIAHARPRLRIYEVGISYSGRTYEEGKKIGWKDGVWAIWCILKYNLWRRRAGNEPASRGSDHA